MSSALASLDQRKLPQGRPHPESQHREAIQLWRQPLEMAEPLSLNQDADRAYTADAQARSPYSGCAIVQDQDCIRQGAGQIECATFPGTEILVVVLDSGPANFYPGFAL
jgi:hypothetical protein